MLEIKETKQTEEILPQDSMKAAIDKLVKKEELSPQLTKTIMHQIMSGQASPVQIASYLTAMRMKGETAGEISASAEVMRDFSNKVQTKKNALDIVGTGGDQAFTFNIQPSLPLSSQPQGSRWRNTATAAPQANAAARMCWKN